LLPRPALRDASRDGAGDVDNGKVVHLVTGDSATGAPAEADSGNDPTEPPRPPAGGGAKPSLKRIK
jgi:stringent starvation protein B